MRIKISITLSEELLDKIDARVQPQKRSRSDFVQEAARAFLAQVEPASSQTHEAVLLREHAAALNAEMADILGYQALP
jgi:metal-responsive CopG/Arc/MetJ family transcriptional regulator